MLCQHILQETAHPSGNCDNHNLTKDDGRQSRLYYHSTLWERDVGYISVSTEDPGEIRPTSPQKDTLYPMGRSPHQCHCPSEANTTSIEAMVVQNQLRWAGHYIRMSDNHLPRQVVFAQLTHGTRIRGGQGKRFKDSAKHYIKKDQIDTNAWQRMDAECPLWPCTYLRQRPNLTKPVYFTRRRNGIGERRRICLNIFTSPFHLAPPAHTATRSADERLLSHLRTHD